MLKGIAHRAERDGFITFFTGAIENNNTKCITGWVIEKLLSKNPPISEDKKLAFFEAEKILLKSYIGKGNIDYTSKLFTAINNDKIENPKLKKIGCQILADSLIEEKDTLTNDKTHNKELKDLLTNEYNKLTTEHKNEISDKINEALAIIEDAKVKEVLTEVKIGQSSEKRK